MESRAFHDAVFVVDILANFGKLSSLDLKCALIFLETVTSKDLHINYSTLHAGRNTQRSVFHVRSLFSENCAKQLLFRCQLCFAFGSYFADENIARIDFRSDIHNSRLVQFAERAFTYIWNICSNFFRPKLGIACHTGKFLYVNGCQAILFDHSLRNKNRVFEVVAIPGHESDSHVLTKCQLTHIH